MSSVTPQPCGPCAVGGICGGKGKQTLVEGLWTNNPISIQILGICSALAVTNRLENSLVMGVALIFVCVGSNLFVSLLRNVTPRRVRMIAEVAIIATFVIVFDLFLKAFYYDMSKMLGPYVGLIITNCIIMGRAEAFALQNRPIVSMVDGFANGLGYAIVLGIIGFFRELTGMGVVPGVQSILIRLVAAYGAIVPVVGVFGLIVLVVVLVVALGLLAWRYRLLRAYGFFVAIALGLAAFSLWRRSAGVPLTAPVRLPDWYVPNQLMILAPGAFVVLGFLIAAFNAVKGPQPEASS